MPTPDPNIIIPALFALVSSLCTGVCTAFLALVGVTLTAYFNNRSGHDRHKERSRENEHILFDVKTLRDMLDENKNWTASRFQDLQNELNECKNALAKRMKPPQQ